MKLLNILSVGFLLTLVASCDKPLETNLDSADVTVLLNENVVAEGNVIKVKKGTPITFNIIGEPDYVSFFSGETGHNYSYKDRAYIDMDQIKSSELTFGINLLWGNASNIFKILYSTEFSGMLKNDFYNDSLALEKAQWTELIPQADLPQVAGTTGDEDKWVDFKVDMKQFFGQNITLAIRYEGLDATQTQSKLTFKDMKITNKMANGDVIVVDASQFGFTPINLNYKDATKDQINALPSSLKLKAQEDLDVLQYATVTNGAAGFWRTDQIGTGKFWMNSADPKNNKMPMTYSWIVSEHLAVNACEPDAGVSVKNMSTVVDKFEYTYNEVGTYKATFSMHNANYKYSEEKLRTIIINVE